MTFFAEYPEFTKTQTSNGFSNRVDPTPQLFIFGNYNIVSSSNNIPAENVEICAFDRNLTSNDSQILFYGGDEACTVTSSDGFFRIYVDNDDPDDSTFVDLVLVMNLQNENVKSIDFNTNMIISDTPPNTINNISQTILNVNTLFAPRIYSIYYNDFTALNTAHTFFDDELNYDIPFVTLEENSDRTVYCEGSDCGSIQDRIKLRDIGDPIVVVHEYGHHIQHKLYQSIDGEIPPCDSHIYSRVSSPSCSWAEGFAWFVPALVSDSPTFTLTTGNVEFNLEDGTFGHITPTPFPSSNVEYSEGLVASALWDIYDSTNESGDNISNNLMNIWDAFNDSPAQNIESWETEWDDNASASLDSIFNLNKIRLSTVIPTPTNTITSFLDGFEGDLTSWTLSGDSNWEIDNPEEILSGSNNMALVSSDCDTVCIAEISDTFDTSNPLTISFDRFVDSGVDSGEGLFVEYSTDEITWIVLDSFTDDNNKDTSSWEHESLSLNVSSETAKIRFVAKSSQSTEHVEIDNLRIVVASTGTGSRPDTAPVISSISDVSFDYSEIKTINVLAIDSQDDPIVLTLVNSSSFASIVDSGNGSGVVTLSPLSSDVGIHSVTVKALANLKSDFETFGVTVYQTASPTPETEIQQSDLGVTIPGVTRDGTFDFNLYSDNTSPTGIAAINDKLWVLDITDDKVYAYNSNGTPDASFDIDLDADNTIPTGIAAYNEKLWIIDFTDDKVYAYNSNGTRDAASDFDLHSDNTFPTGIAALDNKLWVADDTDDKVYAYDSADGSPDTSSDFELDSLNSNPIEITSLSNKLWVADVAGNKVYVYNSDGTRDDTLDFDLDVANTDPEGIAALNGKLWVVDTGNDIVYAYNTAEGIEFSIDGLDASASYEYSTSKCDVIAGTNIPDLHNCSDSTSQTDSDSSGELVVIVDGPFTDQQYVSVGVNEIGGDTSIYHTDFIVQIQNNVISHFESGVSAVIPTEPVNLTLTAVSIESDNSNDTSLATAGDIITLSFTSSEPISEPVVTINGVTAVVVAGSDNTDWTATRTITATDDTDGPVTFTIDYADLASNTGTQITGTTDNSSVTVVQTESSSIPISEIQETDLGVTNTGGIKFSIDGLDPSTYYEYYTEKCAVSDPDNCSDFTFAKRTNSNGELVVIMAGPFTSLQSVYVEVKEIGGVLIHSTSFTVQVQGNAITNFTSNVITTEPPITDQTNPTLTVVSIESNNSNDTSFATAGDVVTLSFTSSEGILTPIVTINGVAASTVTGSNTSWTATRTITAADIDGSTVTFTIDYADLASNAGTQVIGVTDSTGVIIDQPTTPPSTSQELQRENLGVTNTGGIKFSIDGLDPSTYYEYYTEKCAVSDPDNCSDFTFAKRTNSNGELVVIMAGPFTSLQSVYVEVKEIGGVLIHSTSFTVQVQGNAITNFTSNVS